MPELDSFVTNDDLAEIHHMRKGLPFMIIEAHAPNSALIVIDLVQDYFSEDLWPNSRIPAARQHLVDNTNELVSIFRRNSQPVIWFRQEFLPDMSDAFLHVRRSNKRYAVKGTPGSALLPELSVAESDPVLVKKRYSAFYQTELPALLQNQQVQTVVLAGITTAWCIRSTAVDAYQRDYDVIIARDCIDAFTLEEHNESLAAMQKLLGRVWSNAEIARATQKPGKNYQTPGAQ